MDENNGGFGAFLSGFIMGVLVGGAVMLLFAPQAGEETRTLIKDKGIELKDKTSEKAEEYRQKSMDSAATLQQRGQVLIEEQKSRLSKKTSGDITSEEIELPNDSQASLEEASDPKNNSEV